MPYATIADVESFNAIRTFTPTSRPAISDVDRFLHETAAVLDGILAAQGYQLPVPPTATAALDLFEHYNAIGGWAYTEAAAPESDARDISMKAWENAQKMLRDGLIEPPGLPRDEGTTRIRSGFAPTPMFTRCMEF